MAFVPNPQGEIDLLFELKQLAAVGGNQMQPAGTEVQAGQIIDAGEMVAASDMMYAGTQVPTAGNEQNNNGGSSSPTQIMVEVKCMLVR